MSYSFSVRAASKTEAKEAVAKQMAAVVENQPRHEKDQVAAVAVASTYIEMLGEPGEGQSVYVNVNGSLGWSGEDDDAEYTHANVSVQASLKSE